MGRPAGAPPSPAAPHQPPFVTLGELLAGVADGSRVGVGGALLTRLPLAAVHALAGLRGELVLQSLHPGVSRAGLRAGTGFEPAVADDLGVTEEPSAEMLRVLREEIDPLGIRRLEFAPARERAGRLAACIAAEQDLIDRARCLSLRRDGAPHVKE